MANFSIMNSTVYAGTAQNNLTATYATLLAVAASSGGMVGPPPALGLRRGKLYDILVGTAGTPADNYVEFEVARATVGTTLTWLGTVSSVSSNYTLDPADPAFSAFAVMNASAETNISVTGQAWYVGINQRASYRWVCAPGSEIVYPAVSSATGNNGLALKARGSATIPGTATIMVSEQ